MQVILHGGAGGVPDDPTPRQAVMDDAAADALDAPDPLGAVERAVRAMEASPRFNAGTGSAVQSDGQIRTDAGVMTDDRRVGAIASAPDLTHAVSVARVVLEATPHVLVSGDHAVELATAYGVETGDLFTDRSRERLREANPPEGDPREHLDWLTDRFGDDDGGDEDDRDHTDHDTVGAVARAGEDYAAATSTGGRWFALAGRVGDVPQVGSGFYCAPAGGARATGAGEDIARVTLSRQAVRHLEAGHDADAAASLAIEEFDELTGSSAGVIVAGPNGVGSAYNSSGMQTALAQD